MEPTELADPVLSIDWASKDRQAFLRTLPCPKKPVSAFILPGLATREVWMEDVSGLDRRSVKAQLAGRGDGRASWWIFHQTIYQWCYPERSAEYGMAAFHRRHHALTLHWMAVRRLHRTVFDICVTRGVVEAARYCFREIGRT